MLNLRNTPTSFPTTRDALYEIALLQPDELRLCFENRYSRSSSFALLRTAHAKLRARIPGPPCGNKARQGNRD